MRLKCTLFLLLFAAVSQAQNLTGIWRGHFVHKQFNAFYGVTLEDRYRYEVQLNQLVNNALKGVTYSYKTTVFYGKTSLQGIYTKGTNNVLIKELKMLELKIEDMSDPCMMTCNLEYSKVGNKETLTGTYTSINMKTKEDCGAGTVYLEKVPDSDFEKEDFLLKKKPEPTPAVPATPKINPPAANSLTPKLPNNNKPLVKKTTPTPKVSDLTNTPAYNRGKVKPGAEDALVKKTEPKETKTSKPLAVDSVTQKVTSKVQPTKEVTKQVLPRAKELTTRTNNLVKTLFVDEGEVEIALYDNGEIDNDTISVYHNNELVIAHGRLSASPLLVKIKVDASHPTHEFVMVADNLGEIPPNTSLMTITAGKKQYSVFLSSDETKNAKVVIQYKPGQDQSKN
jgi:hypothetical protein